MKDPGQQEHFVEHLHFCETVTALAVLKPGRKYFGNEYIMYTLITYV